MKLDFICVGVYRSGTTWLHSILQKHPLIILPHEKETMFYSHHYHKGIDWYINFFPDVTSDHLIGEICPTYLTNPLVAERIYKHFPNTKIFMILRDPIDQIKSLYNLWRIRGYTNLDINKALFNEEELLNNVMYYSHIKRYLDFFGHSNIAIFFYDDLVENPKLFFSNVCKELTLDFEFFKGEDFSKKINASNRTAHPSVELITAKVGDYMRRHGFFKLRNIITRTGIIEYLKKSIPSKSHNSFSSEINNNSKKLICERILPEIQKLQDIVKKDLSHWIDKLDCN